MHRRGVRLLRAELPVERACLEPLVAGQDSPDLHFCFSYKPTPFSLWNLQEAKGSMMGEQ